jgi:hypothetical protein
MTTDAHRLRPDHHPTPFSADEIRDGCPPGRTVRMLVEQAGQDPVVRVTRFVRVDAEGADQEVTTETLDGAPIGEPLRRRSTWLEFQGHASMPIATTTIGEATIDIPAGRFDCLVYTRTDGDSVSTFWFAKVAPGMPLMFEERSAQGTLGYRATAIANETPGV